MIDWDDSPTLDAVKQFPVNTGFSKFHAKLLEVEFAASVEKERKGTQEESHVKAEPHPYDVFVMKTTFGSKQGSNISVVLPMKGGLLQWWDGEDDFASLKSDQHVYRIASLSGSARVLESLERAKLPRVSGQLSAWAMRRENLVDMTSDNNAHDLSVIGSLSNLFFGGPQAAPLVESSILDPLNESQRQAVLTVANPKYQNGFFAIQGPPGCGKTTTMVAMISAIGTGMIVAAPSNAAVANLALKLFATGQFSFPNICIFGDGCDESVRFLNPRFRSEEYKKAAQKIEALDDLDIPPDEVRQLEVREKQKESIRRNLARWLHVEENLSLRDLSWLCPNIPLDETGSVAPEGRRVINRLMRDAQVLLCTLNSSGSFYFQNAASDGRFHTYLLDEGGQCTEAEFFIATTFPGVKRIIVMGDPKQLRPTVLEPACSNAGYGESWIGRVYKMHPSKVHLLDTQYRMDPAILKFPNKRFYNKRIRSGDNVKNRSPPVERAFRFIDTESRGREERDENFSFRNSYEIAVIRDILKNDSDIVAILNDKPDARIIIITPYKAQVKLLQAMARTLKFANLEISTVDAFQGQEGEIVILSTVRTKFVGFVDDGQRLNVALTRAKRILRVIGDRKFFLGLPAGSTLRALSTFSTNTESVQATKIRSIPTCPPDLTIQTRWKITLTQRFHNVIGELPLRDKYVALNTLFALALPDVKALGNRVAEKEGWHTTWHSGHGHLRVIWVARNHEGVGIAGIVEAHFAGSQADCLRFRQINHIPPDGCCSPRADMSGVVPKDLPPPENGRMFVSWSLDSHLQHAILTDQVPELPLSMIQLDPPQERIARSPPHLLIESRSGTGKTLVLLQHAAFYHRASDPRPACFITVSPRLTSELQQRYDELTPIHGAGLPKTQFFSFRDFISGLLSHYGIDDFDCKDRCTFQGYVMARRSHQKLQIEPHLLENELGGVIMGSVVAAQQGEPLNREQYQQDKRSNIPNKTEEGRAMRNIVYDEYEQYNDWKWSTQKYDIHEAVLRLQKVKPQQLFSSAYLDEVQDLSHAAIFLICGMAGRDKHYWVCGGDPAQMISPGCSFTFDGLKQTLLALEDGIEKKIKKVEHLLVNYRTTKDILMLGNQILATARRNFPGAIDFARPERARKDLGLKVAVCSWKAAFDSKAKFGDNQAFIYSSNQPEGLVADARQWLDNHPFILSSLDSKGLEFDDVVVAFDHDRKTFQVEAKREASLGMLRELYVAVTRAQRRVVILIKEGVPAMAQFFESLDCDLEMVDSRILEEFNCDTSSEEWFKRAQKLFKNYQFHLAASCFTRAERQDWSLLAQGRRLWDDGLHEEAAREFRRAARIFYEGRCYDEILDILLRLLQMNGLWDATDDRIFKDAINALPNKIPRVQVIHFAIIRGDFSSVLITDLKNREVSQLLMEYRTDSWLKKLIADCSEDDRVGISNVMPMVVFDYHIERSDYHQACRVALCAREWIPAENATVAFLDQTKKDYDPKSILKMAAVWKDHGPPTVPTLSPQSPSILLSQLFQSPKEMPSTSKLACTNVLGKEIVMLAVDYWELDRTILLNFGATEFKPEVDSLITMKLGPDLLNVVRWYDKHGHPALASQFVKERLHEWSNDDLFRISMDLWTRPQWLFDELKRRHLLDASIALIVLSPFLGQPSKKQFIRSYLSFQGGNNNLDEPPDLEAELDKSTRNCVGDLEGILARMTIRWQLLEKAFLQLWLGSDMKIAVQYSWEAIETHDLARTNITRLLRVWDEIYHRKESRSDKSHQQLLLPMSFSARTFEAKVSFLLCLFFGDEPTEPRLQFYRGVKDPFYSLLIIYGPTVASYCKLHQVVLNNKTQQGCQEDDFDVNYDDLLLQRLKIFHDDLRSNLQSRYVVPACGGGSDDQESNPTVVGQTATGNNGSADKEVTPAAPGGMGEAKTLSKKAARKLRKQQHQQKKKQQANSATGGGATTTTNNNSTTKANKKKPINKKNNKKKKGRR